jgi:hypothetical protein
MKPRLLMIMIKLTTAWYASCVSFWKWGGEEGVDEKALTTYMELVRLIQTNQIYSE